MRNVSRRIPKELRDLGYAPTQIEGGGMARDWPNGAFELHAINDGPGGYWRRGLLQLASPIRKLGAEALLDSILNGEVNVVEHPERGRILVPAISGGGDDYVGVTDVASGAGVADVRVRSRTIAAVTAKEQYVIPISERVKSAVLLGTFQGTVQAAAHAATAGFWFLQVPNAATVLAALRRFEISTQMSSNLSTPTAPRIGIERETFTNVAQTGTAIVPTQRDSSDTAKACTWTSTNTGPVLTAGAAIYYVMPVVTTGTAAWSYTMPTMLEFEPSEDGMVVLRALQGLVCRQPDAGTTADTRKAITNIAWEEFTLP